MANQLEQNKGKMPLGSFDNGVDSGEIFPELDPAFNLAGLRRPYLVNANPARELAILEGRRQADDIPFANCQLHLWLIYNHVFGYTLIPDMLSQEIWNMKNGLFVPVDKRKQMHSLGDIYFLKPWPIEGRSDFDPNDPKRLHVAVGTGIFENGIPEITHTSKETGTAVIELLTDLTKPQGGEKRAKYQKLLGVRRLEGKGKHGSWDYYIGPHIGKYLYIQE